MALKACLRTLRQRNTTRLSKLSILVSEPAAFGANDIKFLRIGLAKNHKHPFFTTIKAFIMLKLERLQECTDLLVEVKPTMQRDAFTLVYLVKIYEALHQDSEVIKILESV